MAQDGLVSVGRSLLAADGPPLAPHVQAGLAVGVVVVVAIAGVMSGLTLGLLSMDRLDLELMLRTGSKRQERLARRLAPIISQPHWVLTTLVICNTAAGMALPLCLDRLVNVVVALVLSTTAIVLFGEILPQAVCSRYGLSIGGHAAPVVRLLMWLTAPISWPISKALDALLGHEQPIFGKRQISALVDLHRESAGMGGPLNEEEAHVIQGVLDLSSKTGNKAMTPLSKVFMLSTNDILNRPTLKRILDSGHSRVPVYRGTNRCDIIGLILVKELLAVVGLSEPGSGPVHVRDLRVRDLPALPLETPMTDLLNLFQTGHSHMALLLQNQDVAAGKDAAVLPATITAVASCSSSEGGSTPVHPGGCGNSHRANPMAALLKSLSGKALKRSNSSRKDRPENKQGEQQQSDHDADASRGSSKVCELPSLSAATVDNMEAGMLQGSVDCTAKKAHILPSPYPATAAATKAALAETESIGARHHAVSTPGLDRPSAPGALGLSRPSTQGLGRPSAQGLARPSPASVWRDAGWDAAGGIPVGIITLEDVLEELMQEEIVDETDTFIDNEKTCRVNARVLAMSLPPGLRRLLVTSQQLQLHRQQQQQQQHAPASGSLHSFNSSPQLCGAGGNSGTSAGGNAPGGKSCHAGSIAGSNSRLSVGGPGGTPGAASGASNTSNSGSKGQQAMWPATVG